MIQLLRRLRDWGKGVFFWGIPDSWVVERIVRKWPYSATLEVTTACGLQCPLCFTHVHVRSNRFMDAAYALDVIETCAERLRWVSFHMQGEPLAHRGLFDLVRACTTLGIKSGFSSNGMLLERYQDDLLTSGLSHLSIAIDGCDAVDYERYRRGGNFETVTRNTRQLLRERKGREQALPAIQLQTIMFPYNEEREHEVVSFLESFGADSIRLKRPSYCNSGEGIEASQASLDFLEGLGKERETARYSRAQIPTGTLYRDRALCPQLERAAILSDGRVVACCMDAVGMTTFGDLGQQSFSDIWRSDLHRDVLRAFLENRLDICKYCDLA